MLIYIPFFLSILCILGEDDHLEGPSIPARDPRENEVNMGTSDLSSWQESVPSSPLMENQGNLTKAKVLKLK